MTKDDVLRMAKEAAQFDGTTTLEKSVVLYAAMSKDFLEKFAALVRQDEKEACAEICDGISEWYETRTDLKQTQKQIGQLAAGVCGVRIRERG
jgi:hypothetical protein